MDSQRQQYFRNAYRRNPGATQISQLYQRTSTPSSIRSTRTISTRNATPSSANRIRELQRRPRFNRTAIYQDPPQRLRPSQRRSFGHPDPRTIQIVRPQYGRVSNQLAVYQQQNPTQYIEPREHETQLADWTEPLKRTQDIVVSPEPRRRTKQFR